MSVPEWSGRRVQQARAYMTRNLPAMYAADDHAATCPGVIDGTDPTAWVVGHIASRIEHPEQTWRVANWRIEARVCSDKSGPATALAKARADGARAALEARDEQQLHVETTADGALFPAPPTPTPGRGRTRWPGR